MSSEEDGARQQAQQQQTPQEPEAVDDGPRGVERQERLRDTLHGNAEYVRQERKERMERMHDAEYVRGLLAFDPDPARGGSGLSRVVDMKIPLWGVLGSLGAFAIMISTLWFTVQNQGIVLKEIQVALREGSSSNTAADRELARMALQIEQLKEEVRDNRARLDAATRDLQQRRSSAPGATPRRPPMVAYSFPWESPL